MPSYVALALAPIAVTDEPVTLSPPECSVVRVRQFGAELNVTLELKAPRGLVGATLTLTPESVDLMVFTPDND